ncbi:hypothetical protein [Streptomyces sp. NBC_00199]|uniref:hypothetical protein n=1 Tax=Streptomyces sp. NBC_00199 TaxID=2975678 RepID=UPI00224E9A44|nr:hypothetical protein [Streptomyces sp. NBC_00199]MCX5269981.1 hypothetical protein [Streptomyces sp. NBC_00199]
MLIYEYLPHELARLGVVSKAAGLDGRQVAAQVRLAQERVGSARVLPAEPHLSELFIAELRRLQWERIACLMEKERMAVYTPSCDWRAVRYEEQHLQRLVVDVAAAERSGVAAPEISRHRVYRIGARPAAGSRQDMPAPTVHLMAASPGEAAGQAWAVHGGDGGLYRRGGGYRIASVEQALPEPGELF